MSRVGKVPIEVPQGVEFVQGASGKHLSVKGQKGSMELRLNEYVSCEYNEKERLISLKPRDATKESKAYWGLYRSLLNNIVVGVSVGFKKVLELVGVGYKASMLSDKLLALSLGYSNQIIYAIPEGVSIVCHKQNKLEITGYDKQVVGQVAADIRALRKPEPYKGKGIKYEDEVLIRKEGKKK